MKLVTPSILITDDDRDFRETLGGLFEPRGFRTFLAGDGEEALDIIRREQVHLALFDMHIHLSGINYGAKGEKNHLSFAESDFNYTDCLKALKDYKVKGCVICESPILEKDAALLKETYNRL